MRTAFFQLGFLLSFSFFTAAVKWMGHFSADRRRRGKEAKWALQVAPNSCSDGVLTTTAYHSTIRLRLVFHQAKQFPSSIEASRTDAHCLFSRCSFFFFFSAKSWSSFTVSVASIDRSLNEFRVECKQVETLSGTQLSVKTSPCLSLLCPCSRSRNQKCNRSRSTTQWTDNLVRAGRASTV